MMMISVEAIVDRRMRWRDEVAARREIAVSNGKILGFVVIDPELQVTVRQARSQ